jgi:tetratricopeptide (TPR) repeat protein
MNVLSRSKKIELFWRFQMKLQTLLLVLLLSPLLIIGQSAQELYRKGQIAQNANKLEEALGFFTQAIESDTEYDDAYLARAFVFGRLSRHDEALKDYDKVVELDPTESYVYVSRGSEYNRLKKYDLAISDFNKAIELDKRNSEAYNNRGWAKKGLGDKKGACKDWKKSRVLGNEEARIILINNQC